MRFSGCTVAPLRQRRRIGPNMSLVPRQLHDRDNIVERETRTGVVILAYRCKIAGMID